MNDIRIGIDLGTCYSNVGYHDQDGMHYVQDPAAPQRTDSIPSSALLKADHSFVFGVLAESEKNAAPEGYQREFKRDLGSKVPYLLRDRKISAADLTAKFLEFLVDLTTAKLGAKPASAVITVPAAFNQSRRSLVEDAARHAGLTRASLIAEPAAAVIGAAKRGEITDHTTTLVYDLGGGTFDAAVVRLEGSEQQVLGDRGLQDFGGTDIDVLIQKDFQSKVGDKFAEILAGQDSDDPKLVARAARTRIMAQDFCRNIKHRLSSTDHVADILPVDFDYELSRAELEDMVRPQLDRTVSTCRELLASIALTSEQIDTVLLVGGGSYMPMVREVLAKELGRPVKRATDPELAVCIGAALHSRTGPQQAAGRQAQEQAGRQAQEQAARQAQEQAGRHAEEQAKMTRGQGWWETPQVYPLQARMRRQAAAGRWADVIETSAQIALLNPTAADPYGIATMARAQLAAQTRLAPAKEQAKPPPGPSQETVKQGHSEPAGLSASLVTTISAPGAVLSVAFSSDADHLALGCDQGHVVITDLAGRQQADIRDNRGRLQIFDVAYDSGGRRLATGGLDSTPRIWDASTGRKVRNMANAGIRKGAVYGVAFSPDGTKLATAEAVKVARVWDASTGRPLLNMNHKDLVYGVAFSSDGRWLATGSYDKTAIIWDLETKLSLYNVTCTGKVFKVAFNPAGGSLAIAKQGQPGQISDMNSGHEPLRVTIVAGMAKIAFSPDGTLLAGMSGGDNTTARIWDAATSRELCTVNHGSGVRSVAFGANSALFATAGVDKKVRLWRLDKLGNG